MRWIDKLFCARFGARGRTLSCMKMTAIPKVLNLRSFDREFALTNKLRTEGTDNLLEAAQVAGARRFVAQSYAGWPCARVGGADQNGGGSTRSRSTRRISHESRGNPASRSYGHANSRYRGNCAALRLVLRSGHEWRVDAGPSS